MKCLYRYKSKITFRFKKMHGENVTESLLLNSMVAKKKDCGC